MLQESKKELRRIKVYSLFDIVDANRGAYIVRDWLYLGREREEKLIFKSFLKHRVSHVLDPELPVG